MHPDMGLDVEQVAESLSKLLAIQAGQQRLWCDRELLTDAERAAQIDELLHGLYEETGELARGLRRKPHIIRPEKAISAHNAVEEMVDILKYLLAIADMLEVDAATLVNRFMAKTRSVEQKVRQRRLDLEGHRVFVTDLDMCVADLQTFFDATGGMYGSPEAGSLEAEERKARWYASGGFLRLGILPGAREGLLAARDAGCLIAIITARPLWEHGRIRPDTVQWLSDMGIPYDILLFNKDKYDALYQSVFPGRVVAFVEDRDKHALELVEHHVRPVYLMDAPWNRSMARHPDITRVSGWQEIVADMERVNWGASPGWGTNGK